MSFTVKCDKCGNEVVFKENDTRSGEIIQIVPYVKWNYSGYEVDGVDFYCENEKCNNDVFIK